jgi:hypothetical protein
LSSSVDVDTVRRRAVKTLTKLDVSDLVRTDRQAPEFLPVMIKMVGTVWMASFVAGITGDVWLAAVVMVGYPAAWSVAWLISK